MHPVNKKMCGSVERRYGIFSPSEAMRNEEEEVVVHIGRSRNVIVCPMRKLASCRQQKSVWLPDGFKSFIKAPFVAHCTHVIEATVNDIDRRRAEIALQMVVVGKVDLQADAGR